MAHQLLHDKDVDSAGTLAPMAMFGANLQTTVELRASAGTARVTSAPRCSWSRPWPPARMPSGSGGDHAGGRGRHMPRDRPGGYVGNREDPRARSRDLDGDAVVADDPAGELAVGQVPTCGQGGAQGRGCVVGGRNGS